MSEKHDGILPGKQLCLVINMSITDEDVVKLNIAEDVVMSHASSFENSFFLFIWQYCLFNFILWFLFLVFNFFFLHFFLILFHI